MLLSKLKEVSTAVIPLSIIVLILHFFFVPLSNHELVLFFTGAVLVLVGLAVFLLGVDVSINKMGQILGQGITKKNNLALLLAGGAIIGFTVSVAEPALTILGSQIDQMSNGLLNGTLVVIVVSLGVGFFLSIGMLRIAFRWDIALVMTICYGIVFLLSFIAEEAFFTFAFDSSGATTGAITVPFILAMSAGMAALGSGDDDQFNFGMVGIASVGPIVAMMVMGLFFDADLTQGEFEVVQEVVSGGISQIILQDASRSFFEVILGILPVLIIFILFNFFIERQSRQIIQDINVGLVYILIGLTMFLTGVSSGFMPVTQTLGADLYENYSAFWPIAIGFILGILAILAEPAIYVLIDQVEEITGGTISKKMVLITICLGVGLAIALTIVRIMIPGLRLWHILLPGFLISIALSWVIPKLFVGLAFDSGGVASGPMTGTFIFAFVQGIALSNPHADVIVDGFGMIAVVAMTPILFIEILGFIYHMATKRLED